MRSAPPIRFLLLLVGGWIGIRTILLATLWGPVTVARTIEPGPATETPIAVQRDLEGSAPPSHATGSGQAPVPLRPVRMAAFAPTTDRAPDPSNASLGLWTPVSGPAASASDMAARPRPVVAPLLPARASRWSGSAWLLLRPDGGGSLAPGGTLGGSQVGGRLLYRLGPDRSPLAASLRVYSPLGDAAEAEAALGLDWRPLSSVPVNLIVERRQALGANGRSAFSILAYGGASDEHLPGGLRLDAYAQAGIVGARSRDLFADGSLKVTRPIGPVSVGGGAWGAAQPGASRFDLGPTIDWTSGDRSRFRLSADWRFRVAGEAEPGSGPALTLAAGF
jgi:hypothetical protein